MITQLIAKKTVYSQGISRPLSVTFYSLEENGKLVSMAKVWDEPNHEGYLDGATLCWVETHPAHRRQGHRDTLLRAISNEVKLYRTGTRSTLGRLSSKNFELPLVPGYTGFGGDDCDSYHFVDWETGIPIYGFEV